MSKRLVASLIAVAFGLVSWPIQFVVHGQPSKTRATADSDSYGEIIAARATQPDSVRLERLTSLYLRQRQGVPKASVVNGQTARWVSTGPELDAAMRAALDAVRSIDHTRLAPDALVDWRVVLHLAKSAVELTRYPTRYLDPWPSDLFRIERMRHESLEDYEDILAWLRGVPIRLHESLDTLRDGLAHGIAAPTSDVREFLDESRSLAPVDPMASPLLRPFTQFPSQVSGDTQRALTETAVAVYRTSIIPAFAEWIAYLEQRYLPASSPFLRFKALPNGAAWYAARVRAETGLDLTPADIHRAALADVRRTEAELQHIARTTGFNGTYDQLVVATRTDPDCRPLDADEIRVHFQNLMGQVEQGLPQLFGTIPRTPYEVVPDPTSPPSNPAAARAGSLTAGRPGQVRVLVPYLWGACDFDGIMLHEAMPGHLLQFHIAEESEHTSDLRRQIRWTAFAEGWATYASSLWTALGLDLSAKVQINRLAAQRFIAVRTVIATGIHEEGWSRGRAVEYYKQTLPWGPEAMDGVVDGAASYPEWFLSYFVGEQKIKMLRAHAERELGRAFDIRAFHDEILRNGQLPLDVLDAQIGDWIASRKRSRAVASP